MLFRSDVTSIPKGVEVTSIGSRWDPIVTAADTRLVGADNIVIDAGDPLHAHQDLPADAATTREVALALAGLPPSCEALIDRVADAIAGWGLRAVERTLGLAVALVS